MLHQQSIKNNKLKKIYFEKYSKKTQKTNILLDKTKPKKTCLLLSGQNLLALAHCRHRGRGPLNDVFQSIMSVVSVSLTSKSDL